MAPDFREPSERSALLSPSNPIEPFESKKLTTEQQTSSISYSFIP